MNIFKKSLRDHIEIINTIPDIEKDVLFLSQKITETIKAGHKILIMGNGGSAADSQHMATELAVHYKKNRRALPAIALTTDTSVITAAANDFSFNFIFSRQIEAIALEGDLVIGISTSGQSKNIIEGIKAAKSKECFTAALLGCGGGNIAKSVDYPVIIASDIIARIQECHILIIHIICELIEEEFNES